MNRGVGGACYKHSTDQLSELRSSLPPHTCPTIAPVVAYLEARGRDDLVNLVSVWMADTAKVRAVAVAALRLADSNHSNGDERKE